MQERLESLFGHASPGWLPPADLMESADEFVLTLEVPGLDRSDVQIELQGNTLTVRGKRSDGCCATERYQQFERSRGPFTRSFQFGVGLAGDGIMADLADGVLTIRLPKVAPVRAQPVPVE